MGSDPTVVQQLFLFLDGWFRYALFTVFLFGPACVIGLSVILGALILGRGVRRD